VGVVGAEIVWTVGMGIVQMKRMEIV